MTSERHGKPEKRHHLRYKIPSKQTFCIKFLFCTSICMHTHTHTIHIILHYLKLSLCHKKMTRIIHHIDVLPFSSISRVQIRALHTYRPMSNGCISNALSCAYECTHMHAYSYANMHTNKSLLPYTKKKVKK